VAYHDHVENANALKDPRFNQIAARAILPGHCALLSWKETITLPEPPTICGCRHQGMGRVRVGLVSVSD
jgi:hypothetical protein